MGSDLNGDGKAPMIVWQPDGDIWLRVARESANGKEPNGSTETDEKKTNEKNTDESRQVQSGAQHDGDVNEADYDEWEELVRTAKLVHEQRKRNNDAVDEHV